MFVNFDLVNMILYGMGELIEVLCKVGWFVKSVYCKDVKWVENLGKEWG